MNVFDIYAPEDIGASAVLTKGNSELNILLIENPAYLDTQPSTFSTLVQIINTATDVTTTLEKGFNYDRAAASKQFDVWLDKYRSLGYVFKYEQ